MGSHEGKWRRKTADLDPGFEAPRCHAPTIASAPHGLVLACVGGEQGAGRDLWVMRQRDGAWTPAVRLAASTGSGDECWYPVLYQKPRSELVLFFKQGSGPDEWEGRISRSQDGGVTWSSPCSLPEGITGPARTKPVELDDGALLCPSVRGPDVAFERTRDLGRTWATTGRLVGPESMQVAQPTLLLWPTGLIQALFRSRIGCVVQTWSADDGVTWGGFERTDLPNPNSAIDAVLLPDGRALLVYNPTPNAAGFPYGVRSPLSLAVSEDGREWRDVAVLEDGDDEFSSPAAIVDYDVVHVTYTAGSDGAGIRHVEVDAAAL